MRIDIDHIAKLARLKIDESQKEKFTKQMESMLDLVDSLPPVEAETVETDASNPMVLRKDVIEPSFKREEILKNAPQVQAGCVVVPKIMD